VTGAMQHNIGLIMICVPLLAWWLWGLWVLGFKDWIRATGVCAAILIWCAIAGYLLSRHG